MLQALIVTAVIVAVLMGILIALAIEHAKGDRRILQNACINNLRMIEGAKEQWALELKKTPGDVPTWEDIKIFLGRPNHDLPKCPSGGIYTLGALSNKPTCSIPGHVLQ